MGFLDKLVDAINKDPEDELDNEPELQEEETITKKKEIIDFADDEPRKSNKVMNIHATAQLQVVLVKPERFDRSSECQADGRAQPGVRQQGRGAPHS